MKLKWFFVFVIALFIAYFLFFGGRESAKSFLEKFSSSPEKELKEKKQVLEEEYSPHFISFEDLNHSFRLKYPLGYEAYSPKNLGEKPYLVFLAGVPDELPVVINIHLLNESFKEVKSIVLRDYSEKEVISQKEVKLNGVNAFLVNGFKEDFVVSEDLVVPGKIYFKQAVFQCRNYRILVNALIPESLLPESAVVDYLIYSIEC